MVNIVNQADTTHDYLNIDDVVRDIGSDEEAIHVEGAGLLLPLMHFYLINPDPILTHMQLYLDLI